jgi:predicted HTH transcriptional regulator
MIEIFTSRIEVTNPGPPINDPRRLIDLPPVSWNKQLAAMMKGRGLRGAGFGMGQDHARD